MLLSFLILFSIISIQNSCADVICDKNGAKFGANITEESLDEQGAEFCEYIFAPKLNESVILSGFSSYYTLEIWLIFYKDSFEENEIYLDKIRKRANRYYGYDYKYESPKSTGIRVKFHNTDGYGISFDFSRNPYPVENCAFPIRNLIANENLSIILKRPTNDNKCVYRLIPPENSTDFNEILIQTSTDYTISRRDENGTILKAEQFAGTKFFATQVLDIYLSKNLEYGNGQLKANLVHKSCNCGSSDISTNSTITTIRSPGFPKANCHHRKCKYNLNFEPSDNPNIVLLFNVVTNFEVGDRFIVNDEFNFHSKKLPESFVLPPTNLDMEYQAGPIIADRSFEINITKIDILEQCRCSSYYGKIYNDLHGKIELKIPKLCSNIFCHWIIENDQKKTSDLTHKSFRKLRVVFNIEFENPNINDSLIFNYNSNNRIRKSTVFSTNDFPVHIDFQRLEMDISTDTHITITWNFTLDCSCPTSFIQIAENQSILLTSPNYPDKYCRNMNCQVNVKSENETQIEILIEKLELENFHDYLKIDKNIELTGTYRNHTVPCKKIRTPCNFAISRELVVQLL